MRWSWSTPLARTVSQVGMSSARVDFTSAHLFRVQHLPCSIFDGFSRVRPGLLDHQSKVLRSHQNHLREAHRCDGKGLVSSNGSPFAIFWFKFQFFSVPIVLVGNKTDLHQERAVTTDEGKKLAESWKATFLETSAKQNESVDDIFTQLLIQVEKDNNGSNPQSKSCIIS